MVYVNSRYGQIVRQYVIPRNPQTPDQQNNRSDFGTVSGRWRALDPAQRIAWCLAAADSYTVSRTGRRVALNGYNYFIRVNAARAHLGLSQFDLPPAVPSFSPNPVAELSVTNTGGTITLKLRVPGQPGQHTLVQGAAPVSAGVRCVQHFPLLGLLPAPGRWLERHHRALRCPVWRADSRHRGLHPHLSAHRRLDGSAESRQRLRSGRLTRPGRLPRA